VFEFQDLETVSILVNVC